MPSIQLEHGISDFETWKAAFDADPIRRAESGVRRYRITRPVDDERYVVVELDFDTLDEATAFRTALEGLWRSAKAAPALAGAPKARIVDVVEVTELRPAATTAG